MLEVWNLPQMVFVYDDTYIHSPIISWLFIWTSLSQGVSAPDSKSVSIALMVQVWNLLFWNFIGSFSFYHTFIHDSSLEGPSQPAIAKGGQHFKNLLLDPRDGVKSAAINFCFIAFIQYLRALVGLKRAEILSAPSAHRMFALPSARWRILSDTHYQYLVSMHILHEVWTQRLPLLGAR